MTSGEQYPESSESTKETESNPPAPADRDESLGDEELLQTERIVERLLANPKTRLIMGLDYRGPLPPASEMKGYAEADSTLPMRIMEMAEAEQKARHKYKTELMERESTVTA